jgi:hypothetical protein
MNSQRRFIMNVFFKTKTRRLAGALAFAVIVALVLGAMPSQAGPCERALGICLADGAVPAIIGLITTGGLVTAVIVSFCSNGYIFCRQYCI